MANPFQDNQLIFCQIAGCSQTMRLLLPERDMRHVPVLCMLGKISHDEWQSDKVLLLPARRASSVLICKLNTISIHTKQHAEVDHAISAPDTPGYSANTAATATWHLEYNIYHLESTAEHQVRKDVKLHSSEGACSNKRGLSVGRVFGGILELDPCHFSASY